MSVTGKIRLIEPKGVNEHHLFRLPQQRYASGKIQGRERRGLSKGPVGTWPAGSVLGENSFYRETWGTRRRVAMRLNVLLTPGKSYPDVKVQVRDLERVVDIVAPFVPWGVGTRGKFVLLSHKGVNGHRRPVPDAPTSGTPRESEAKFRDGTMWGL